MLSIASLLPLLIPQAIGVTINVASTQCIYCRILWNNVLGNSTYLVNERYTTSGSTRTLDKYFFLLLLQLHGVFTLLL